MEGSQTFTVSLHENQNKNAMRKKKVMAPEWKDKLAKRLKNSGQQYESRDGTLRRAKVPPDQDKACWRRCQLPGCLLPLNDKLHLYGNYWATGSYEIQRTYLAGCISHYQLGNLNRARYFVNVRGAKVECCRATFMKIHAVTPDVLKNVHSKILQGISSITDGRGRHTRRRHRISQELKQLMRREIERVPRIQSHYGRLANREGYLSSDITIKGLFRTFVTRNPAIIGLGRKSWLFRSIFQSMGIRIGPPKADTCTKCDRLQVLTKTAERLRQRLTHERELLDHHVAWQTAYRSMQADIVKAREDQNYVVKCVDLQQVLFSPTLTHSSMFYLRQFSTYNYCVYDGNSNSSDMYVWSEVCGKRGVDEIGSIISKNITESLNPLQEGEERTLVVWSDRCKGQTNNFIMLAVLLSIMKQRYFTSVEQKFLVSGHSYLPCDRAFGEIEKKKRGTSVFVPHDWVTLIREAQPNKPFRVHEMNRVEFKSMKTTLEPIKKPATLRVTDHLWIKICAAAPSQILAKPTHNINERWNNFTILAPGQRGIRVGLRQALELDLVPIIFPIKYIQPLQLSDEKKADIRSMLAFLQPVHRQFYEQYL